MTLVQLETTLAQRQKIGYFPLADVVFFNVNNFPIGLFPKRYKNYHM